MDYQRLILVGNATDDAQRRTSKKGDVTYTTFRLAVSDAKDRTLFFPITAFGQAGELAGSYVTRGRHILVEGRLEVNDTGRYNVVADRIAFGAVSRESATSPDGGKQDMNA